MAITTRAKPARVRASSKIVLQRIPHLLFLGLAGMNDFLYRAATGGLDSLRCRFIQSTPLLDQFLFRLLSNNSHSGTTCHRIHFFNRPPKTNAHDFPYLILHWGGKISRDNFLLCLRTPTVTNIAVPAKRKPAAAKSPPDAPRHKLWLMFHATRVNIGSNRSFQKMKWQSRVIP